MAPCPPPQTSVVGNEDDQDSLENGESNIVFNSSKLIQQESDCPSRISSERRTLESKEGGSLNISMVSSIHNDTVISQASFTGNETERPANSSSFKNHVCISSESRCHDMNVPELHFADSNSHISLKSTVYSSSSSDISSEDHDLFHHDDLFQDEELKDIIRRALDETDISSIEYVNAHQSIDDDDDDGLSMEMSSNLDGLEDCLQDEEVGLLTDDELKLMMGFAIWETDLDFLETHLYIPVYEEEKSDDGMEEELRNLAKIAEKIRNELDLLQLQQIEAGVDPEVSTENVLQLQKAINLVMSSNLPMVDLPILGFRHFWSHRVRIRRGGHNMSKSYDNPGNFSWSDPSTAKGWPNREISPVENLVKVGAFRHQIQPGSFLLESPSCTIPFFIVTESFGQASRNLDDLQASELYKVAVNKELRSDAPLDSLSVLLMNSIANRKPGGPSLRFGTFITSSGERGQAELYRAVSQFQQFEKSGKISRLCKIEPNNDISNQSLMVKESCNANSRSALISLASSIDDDFIVRGIGKSQFSTSDVTFENLRISMGRQSGLMFADMTGRLINEENFFSLTQEHSDSSFGCERERGVLPIEIAYGADGESVKSDISPLTCKDIAFNKTCLSREEYLYRLSHLLECDVPVHLPRDAPLFEPDDDSQLRSEDSGHQIMKTLEATLASPSFQEPHGSNDSLESVGVLEPMKTLESIDSPTKGIDSLIYLPPVESFDQSSYTDDLNKEQVDVLTAQVNISEQDSTSIREPTDIECQSVEGDTSQDNTAPSLNQSIAVSEMSSSSCMRDGSHKFVRSEMLSTPFVIDCSDFETEVCFEMVENCKGEFSLRDSTVLLSNELDSDSFHQCDTSSANHELSRYELQLRDFPPATVKARRPGATLDLGDVSSEPEHHSSELSLNPSLMGCFDLKLHGIDGVGEPFEEWMQVSDDNLGEENKDSSDYLLVRDECHAVRDEMDGASISIEEFAVEVDIYEEPLGVGGAEGQECSVLCHDKGAYSAEPVEIVEEDDDGFEITLFNDSFSVNNPNEHDETLDCDRINKDSNVFQLSSDIEYGISDAPILNEETLMQVDNRSSTENLASWGLPNEIVHVCGIEEDMLDAELNEESVQLSWPGALRESKYDTQLPESTSHPYYENTKDSRRLDIANTLEPDDTSQASLESVTITSNDLLQTAFRPAQIVMEIRDEFEVEFSLPLTEGVDESCLLKDWHNGSKTTMDSSHGSVSYSCPSTEDTTAYSDSLSSFLDDGDASELTMMREPFSPARGNLLSDYQAGSNPVDRGRFGRNSGRLLLLSTISMVRGFAV